MARQEQLKINSKPPDKNVTPEYLPNLDDEAFKYCESPNECVLTDPPIENISKSLIRSLSLRVFRKVSSENCNNSPAKTHARNVCRSDSFLRRMLFRKSKSTWRSTPVEYDEFRELHVPKNSEDISQISKRRCGVGENDCYHDNKLLGNYKDSSEISLEATGCSDEQSKSNYGFVTNGKILSEKSASNSDEDDRSVMRSLKFLATSSDRFRLLNVAEESSKNRHELRCRNVLKKSNVLRSINSVSVNAGTNLSADTASSDVSGYTVSHSIDIT